MGNYRVRKRNMPAIAGIFLVSEEGFGNPWRLSVDLIVSCRITVLPDFKPGYLRRRLEAFFLAFRLAGRFFALRLAFFLAFFFTLRLAFFFALRLAFFFVLRFAFFLVFLLAAFFFVLRFATFFFAVRRLATFRFAFLRVTLRFFATLRLEAFFTRLLFGSHYLLRVGYPALSIYNKSEKSSKSSDAVNIFEIVFYRKISCKKGENFNLKLRRLSSDEKVSQIGA